jgi:hypothetical protein
MPVDRVVPSDRGQLRVRYAVRIDLRTSDIDMGEILVDRRHRRSSGVRKRRRATREILVLDVYDDQGVGHARSLSDR